MENWLAVANKTELTLKQSHSYDKEKLVYMSTKKVYRNVHSSFIHKQKMVSAPMTINSRMNMIQRNKLLLHTEEPQTHYAKWKKPASKVAYVWFIWHSGKGRTLGMENRSLVARIRCGEEHLDSNGRFGGCILTMVVVTGIYYVLKLIEMYT